jgi:hypothetical protein
MKPPARPVDAEEQAMTAVMAGSPAMQEGGEADAPPPEMQRDAKGEHATALLADIQAKLAELQGLIPSV